MFSLICVWKNGWVKNGEAGDLRRQLAHYDVIVMGLGIREERTERLTSSWLLLMSGRQLNLRPDVSDNHTDSKLTTGHQ